MLHRFPRCRGNTLNGWRKLEHFPLPGPALGEISIILTSTSGMSRRRGKKETDGYLENVPVEKLSTGENPDYGTKQWSGLQKLLGSRGRSS